MTRAYLALPLFLIVTVGGGALIGLSVDTGGWYQELVKPSFNPPDWVFPPVWASLYLLIALAGWRVWDAGELAAARIWWLQLALNFVWPPLFFTLHATGPALAVIVALLSVIVGFMALTAKAGDRVSSLLFTPYALWVAYAGLLNAAIWWLN